MPQQLSVDLDPLRPERAALKQRYEAFKKEQLALDMTRGKPSAEQLDLSLDLLTILTREDYRAVDGTDCRNYGGVDGLPEARALLAELLEVAPESVLIGGNSSLTLMHDTVARCLSHGVAGGSPWQAGATTKFLCPSPGYDRHFAVCEHLGIEMVAVDMLEEGPDMAAVEALVKEDASVKGIWIVPKYNNPTGATVSKRVIERLARMQTKADDFRIFWDNAYAVHHLTDSPPALADIVEACRVAGNEDRVFVYGSTSKISFAGAGLAAMASSPANIAWMKAHRAKMTIGPDKLNQLRHVRFFKNIEGIREHMKKHAELIAPKFEAVQRILEANLGQAKLAQWTKPLGGYFVSLDTADGCAARVVELAKAVGVKLTSAGATFPYGKDPRDRNIRIAPTLPTLAEIEQAMDVFCVCVKLATLEKHS